MINQVNKDRMLFTLDWQVPQEEFRNQIRAMINAARENNKVLVLPVEDKQDSLMWLLSSIDCEECDAPCCRRSPPEEYVGLTPSEFMLLREKYGDKGMRPHKYGGAIEMPCRFLKHNRCEVYADRPLVCITYPMQPGGMIDGRSCMALASSCPQARKITKALYMAYWRFKQKVQFIGIEEALQIMNERG